MKAFMLAAFTFAGCNLQEPNPHYQGACVDPVVAEWSQDGHSPCPAEVRDWGTRDPATGACWYRSICGDTWNIGGCYFEPTAYCTDVIQPAGRTALIRVSTTNNKGDQ